LNELLLIQISYVQVVDIYARKCMETISGNESRARIKILLINPNATPTMTNSCLAMLRPQLPPDVDVTGFTAPGQEGAPSAIEGHVDNVLSSAASFRAILAIADQYDAFLIACYSDHALTNMLREEFDQPSIGIMEASLLAARSLGGRFGIVATGGRSKYSLQDAVRKYGLDAYCAGVRSCNIGVLDLERKPEKEVSTIMSRVAKELVEEDGADVITLGCAGMSRLKAAVEQAVGDGVQAIDGVLAGVQILAGLVRMGGRTAKRGIYRSSRVARETRAQNYI
jgi:Asp/Glu/hydantoin racemase